jgi:hypothetical protein
MHRILTLLDNWPAGYPANLKVGYRISGAGRIPDIRPNFQLGIQMSSKRWNKQIRHMYWRFSFHVLETKHLFTSKQYRNGFKKTFLEILWIDLVISSIWPDFRLYSVRIRYVAGYPASQIRYPAEYWISKKQDYQEGYPVGHRYQVPYRGIIWYLGFPLAVRLSSRNFGLSGLCLIIRTECFFHTVQKLAK